MLFYQPRCCVVVSTLQKCLFPPIGVDRTQGKKKEKKEKKTLVLLSGSAALPFCATSVLDVPGNPTSYKKKIQKKKCGCTI